jgi:hypothetical protein
MSAIKCMRSVPKFQIHGTNVFSKFHSLVARYYNGTSNGTELHRSKMKSIRTFCNSCIKVGLLSLCLQNFSARSVDTMIPIPWQATRTSLIAASSMSCNTSSPISKSIWHNLWAQQYNGTLLSQWSLQHWCKSDRKTPSLLWELNKKWRKMLHHGEQNF